MITQVLIQKHALKDLQKTPVYLQEKFQSWLIAVNKTGIEEVRKRPGWHDEPLKGDRSKQRSVRLNKQWRVIYIINTDSATEFIEVVEVTPHEY